MTDAKSYWAIQHIPSGGFLPDMGRGQTHAEPTTHLPPRLFTEARAAKMALNWWLNGKITVSHSCDYWGEEDESWHVEGVPERHSDDMRIVRLEFTVHD